MPELISQGLTIGAIGMGLVFGALALLWGVVALLGRLQGARAQGPQRSQVPAEAAQVAESHGSQIAPLPTPPAAHGQQTSPPAPSELEIAAIAAALALMKRRGPAVVHAADQASASTWKALGHGRQLLSWHPRRASRDR